MSKDDKLAGPELGRAALKAVKGWMIEDGPHDYTTATKADGSVTRYLGCLPHPESNVGDAIALLEEWAKGGDQKDTPRFWGCVYFGAGARVLYECRLSWSEYWVGQGKTLEEAICRALVAWGESR